MASKKKIEATRFLKQDHEEVKGLFEEIEALSGRATAKKQKLFDKIHEALSAHARIEEEFFYPALNELRSRDAHERVAEAHEEHALVKQLLRELADGGSESETFRAKLKVLKDIVLHHIKEEERSIFPEAKTGFSKEELEEMGAKLAARKEQILSGEVEAASMVEEESAEMEEGEEEEEMGEEEEEEEERVPSRGRQAEREDRLGG